MTMAMDEVLTAGEVSRMTGRSPRCTIGLRNGSEARGPGHCKLSSQHRRWMRADVVE